MPRADEERKQQADLLYEHYGKPLESDHWGEYVAIFPDGRVLLAPTVLAVVERAVKAFGPGSFVFEVGEKVVWKLRWATDGVPD